MKEKIIKKMIKRGVIEDGKNTVEFLKTIPHSKLCAPLVRMDRKTGKYSYKQLGIKYNLTVSQIRNILRK